MRGNFRFYAVIVSTLVCACICSLQANGRKRGADADSMKEAAALFARAKTLGDMMSPGTPPYALRIHVTGAGQLSEHSFGIYSLQFSSLSEFRRDAAFGASHFSEGAHGDSSHRWRIEDDAPPGLLEEVFLRSMAYAYSPADLERSAASAIVTHRREHGLTLDCVEIESAFGKEACFDSSTGALRAALDNPGFVYQYDDFVPWGNHLAAKTIRVFAKNELILEARVEFLVALTKQQAQAAEFVPPEGAVESPQQASCNLESARLISSAIPSFPRGAGRPDGSGSVLFWGVIDKTGQIDDAIVMQSAGAAYDHAALQAMKQWRYAPARACGEPTEMPGTFRISFR